MNNDLKTYTFNLKTNPKIRQLIREKITFIIIL